MHYNSPVFSMLIICLTPFSAYGADDFIYPDSDRSYAGSVDKDSTLRDAEGSYQGKIKADNLQPFANRGKFHSGFKGGHSFDRTGTYSGKVDSFGHAYDKSGSYSGRIDHFGNVYDRSGNYSGKVKPWP